MADYLASFTGLKALSYFVKRIQPVSRRKLRLTTKNLTEAKAGSHVVVELPPALIDMNTFAMFAKATVTAAASKFATLTNSEALIANMWIESGGVQLTQSFRFADLHSIFESWQAGDRLAIRKALNVFTATTATTGIATAPTTNAISSTPIVINNWVGPLGSMQPRYIDWSLFPQTRIHIILAADDDCLAYASADAAGTYTLSEIEMECDILDVPGDYSAAIMQRLGGGGTLEIPFTQYYDQVGSAQALGGATLQMQLAAQSIDAIFATYRTSAKSNDPVVAASGHMVRYSNHFHFGSAAFAGLNWRLNSVVFPDYGLMTNDRAFLSTVETLAGAQDTVSSIHPAVTNTGLTSFTNGHLLACLRTSFGDDSGYGPRLLSGISSQGAPLNLQLKFGGSSSEVVYPYLFVATTASILVGAGKQVQVVN